MNKRKETRLASHLPVSLSDKMYTFAQILVLRLQECPQLSALHCPYWSVTPARNEHGNGTFIMRNGTSLFFAKGGLVYVTQQVVK